MNRRMGRPLIRIALLSLFVLVAGCSSERSPQQIWGPAFFPDGQRLVFNYGEWATGHELATVDLRTETVTYFGRKGFATEDWTWGLPDVSRDGTKIVFAVNGKGADSHIAIMDSDGRNVVKLTQGPGWRTAPSFSSDSKKIIYLRGRATGGRWPFEELDVFELDRETRRETRLSNMGLWVDHRIRYLDRDSKVVFSISEFPERDPLGHPGFWTAYYDQFAGNRIFAVEKNSIGPDALIPMFQFGRYTRLRDVSADGSVMLFQAATDHLDQFKNAGRWSYSLFIRRGEVISRVAGAEGPFSGSLSADGKRIAFVKKREKTSGYGDDTIWIVNADGTSLRELTLNLRTPGR